VTLGAGGSALAELFARLPVGHSLVEHGGRRWRAVRSVQVDGRSQKVFAEQLGGTGVVSANLYLVGDREELRPCEMPADAVLDFLRGVRTLPWAAVSAGWGCPGSPSRGVESAPDRRLAGLRVDGNAVSA
jgi:peptide-methionine (S)-S-oxide reductase